MSLKYPTGTETLKSEGYKYIYQDLNGYHVLYHIETGIFERWFSNKNTASWAMKYKNTTLEFASSYNDFETERLINYMRKVQNFGEQHPESRTPMMSVYRKYIAK